MRIAQRGTRALLGLSLMVAAMVVGGATAVEATAPTIRTVVHLSIRIERPVKPGATTVRATSIDTPWHHVAMDHSLTRSGEHLVAHLRAQFPGREVVVLGSPRGPIHKRVPGFHVARVAPGGKDGWIYVTTGIWEATQRDGHALEFLLTASEASDLHVKTLAMVSYYHAGGRSFALDDGHTVPIGRPWVPGSACTHLLVTLPYPWGPDLEVCQLAESDHIRLLWLLPITKAERQFKRANGLEALESRLEETGINVIDPRRGSVVPPQPGLLRRAVNRLLP